MPVVRWGLAAKLFATLILLGAVAILVTGLLGYFRSRDALEAAILNQLTAARQTKTSQVEDYFRTVRNDLRVLAAPKMVIDATRGFHAAFEDLEQKGDPDELGRKVEGWYAEHFTPTARRLLGKDAAVADYLPKGAAATYLQYHYIVANPQTAARRVLLDDAGD